MATREHFLEADQDSFRVGMKKRDLERYSLTRVIRDSLRGLAIKDGIEAEMSRELETRAIAGAENCLVPMDVLCHRVLGRRDLNVSTFGQGGAMVASDVAPSIIELLRNHMVTRRLGVRILDGLKGNTSIPRQTAPTTAYALPESATLTKSTAALDQVALVPHRIGAYTEYTKQLLLQSSPSIEDFVREDLLSTIAIKWDKLTLEGAGSNSEPTGILNTIGIGSITFAGSATWAKIISFESALALANANSGNMAFVTTPLVRAAWKNIAKIGTTFPVFLWEEGSFNDGTDDGRCNQYRAAVTNQISNNQVVFGNWRDAVFGIFGNGAVDVIVNPYSRDTDGVIRVCANSYVDCACRHSQSFCWSTDAGNQ